MSMPHAVCIIPRRLRIIDNKASVFWKALLQLSAVGQRSLRDRLPDQAVGKLLQVIVKQVMMNFEISPHS